MSYRDEQKAFLAYSGGKSLSPAEQDAFHGGWQARADVDVAEHVLAAERERELVEALKTARERIADWAEYADTYFRDKWDLVGDLRAIDDLLAKIGAQENSDE